MRSWVLWVGGCWCGLVFDLSLLCCCGWRLRYGVGVGVIAGIIVLDGLCRLVLIVCVWLVLIDCRWFGVWGLSWCVVSCFYRFVCGFWLDLIQAGVLISSLVVCGHALLGA